MKVCFVGSGSIGKRHMINLCSLFKEINMSIEIHLLRGTKRPLEGTIAECIEKSVSDINGLDSFYDMIFITNPTHMHYETLQNLNERSNCFFIEKPVFDRLNLDISAFQETKGKLYYVACPLRYTKVLQRAKEILEKKKVFGVRAISSSYLPEWRPGIDYRETYSAHKNQGGGVRIDLIHEWDYLISLFGMPQRCLSAYGTFSDLELDSEDIASYIGVYPDKIVELHLDYLGRQTKRNFEVFTKDATYLFDIANSYIKKNGELLESFEERPNDKYMEELRFFYSLFRGENKNTNNIIHALQVMQVAYAVE